MLSQFTPPRMPLRPAPAPVTDGPARRMCGSDSEYVEPLSAAIFPEQRQPPDVPPLVSREDDADWRHECGGQSPSPEDDLNQCSSRSAVSVVERVDGLELRMCDRSLDEGRKPFVVAKRAQVHEQSLNVLWRWRHEVRATRIVVVAADPALGSPDAAGDVRVRGSSEQHAMDVDDVLRGDAAGPGRSLDGELHRVDVGQDLGGLRPPAAARLRIDLSSGEVARLDVHPLDFR